MIAHLPVRVSGLPTDVVLEADHTEVRFAGASRTQDLGNWGGIEIIQEGPGNGENRTHQGIRISGALYERIKEQPVRLEIDYSLTLLPLSKTYAIPALHGDERLPGAGWCKTKINDAGTAVQVRCLNAGKPAYCGSGILEHMPGGERNPVQTGCDPDYAPYFGRYFPMMRSEGPSSLCPSGTRRGWPSIRWTGRGWRNRAWCSGCMRRRTTL